MIVEGGRCEGGCAGCVAVDSRAGRGLDWVEGIEGIVVVVVIEWCVGSGRVVGCALGVVVVD